MTKNNKVKTTLDKRHKDKVSNFESHDLIKEELNNELESNLIKLNEIDDIPYIDFTNETLKEKTNRIMKCSIVKCSVVFS